MNNSKQIGGLAIVRAHNYWVSDWTVLVTLSGWASLLLGLVRMFAAGAYLEGSSNTGAITFIIFEGILLMIGLIITFKSYSRDDQ